MEKKKVIRRKKAKSGDHQRNFHIGQKVFLKLIISEVDSDGEKTSENSCGISTGVVGTIISSTRKSIGGKKITGYQIELHDPVEKALEGVDDLFEEEVFAINVFFTQVADFNERLNRHYVTVPAESCYPVLC